MRRFTLHTIFMLTMLLCAIMLGSCIQEHEVPGNGISSGGDVKANFNINLPGDARALGTDPDDEQAIATVNVLAFMNDGSGNYMYAYTAKDVTMNQNGATMVVTVTVKAYPTEQIFVVLANASAEVTTAGITQNDDLDDAMRKVIVSCADEWPAKINGDPALREIPMYAQTTPVTVTETSNNFQTFMLVRMLARIDITLKSDISNFVLEEAAIYNPATKGYLTYNFSGWNATLSEATSAAVPPGSNPGDPILQPSVWYVADQSSDTHGEIVRSIYTFESPGKSEADQQKATAIVIGGYYNGSTVKTYYRCDIRTAATPSGYISQDILRNHWYKIEIQSFSKEGYPTGLEAYKGAKPIDFTVEVIPWGENMNVPLPWKDSAFARSNIVWDGSKLTFAVTAADNQKIPANVQGVFFKWGSLVAISPVGETYSSSQILYSANGTTDYIWTAIPYANEKTGKFGTSEPYEDDFADYDGGSNVSGPGYNASINKGDICRYISDRGWVQGRWRLPTQTEYDALMAEVNSIENGGPFTDIWSAPPGSNSYGNHANGYYQPLSGRWLGKGAANPATRGTAALPGPSSVYCPASGLRRPNGGSAEHAGFQGYWWSGSNIYLANAHCLYITVNHAGRGGSGPEFCFPIRCIRDVSGLAGGAEPILSTDSNGRTISPDGKTYTVAITSNTQWEASIRRSTDVVTAGDTSIMGGPLLNPATGLNGGASSAYVTGSDNGSLTLTTVDYSGNSEDTQGDLTIVFRNKATGTILCQITIEIRSNPLARSNYTCVNIPYTNETDAAADITYSSILII